MVTELGIKFRKGGRQAYSHHCLSKFIFRIKSLLIKGREVLPVNIKVGDNVLLTEKVRHAEFRGLKGNVKKVVKSRGVVEIMCENGKRYRALPENIRVLESSK